LIYSLSRIDLISMLKGGEGEEKPHFTIVKQIFVWVIQDKNK